MTMRSSDGDSMGTRGTEQTLEGTQGTRRRTERLLLRLCRRPVAERALEPIKKAPRVPPLAGVRACACARVCVRVTARAFARTRAPEGPVPERGGGRQCEVDVGACTVDLGYSRVLTQRYSADGFAAQGARTRTVHRMGYLLEGVLGAPHRRLTRSVGALNGYGGTRGALMGTRNVLKLPSPQQGHSPI